MNMLKYLLFLPFLINCFISCSSKNKKSRQPVTKISISPVKRKIISGEQLTIDVKTRLKNGTLNKSTLYLDERPIHTSDKAEYTIQLSTDTLKVGSHQIKVIAVKEDGLQGTNFKPFILNSNINPKLLKYKVEKTLWHDHNHFTQGLEIEDGYMYESTGENGKSGIFKYKIGQKKVLKSVPLPEQYFGEGITIFNDKIYQVTYHAKKGFVYNLDNFAKVDSFAYANREGWGLTHNSHQIIMSDGSHKLTYFDPATMKKVKELQVYDNKGPVLQLNELEYIDGYIWANIWMSDVIVKIDPKTGKVVAKLYLMDLPVNISADDTERNVLNGIAWDKKAKKMYITGKLWKEMFQIKVIE
ncbi:glutaminyl-peptide cyclotransferase [Prolixibacteraceae bacterium JC049]|nr:glutaminyl-peptide cyclotransferase [Prolixibacteraceae bacterium JC049]